MIIFAKQNREKISELQNAELQELTKVMREIETTFAKIDTFAPDRFNYLQMGNSLHHLHFHCIPRYKAVRNFRGENWIDQTWGKPPVWSKTDCDKELILAIKNEVLRKLPSSSDAN